MEVPLGNCLECRKKSFHTELIISLNLSSLSFLFLRAMASTRDGLQPNNNDLQVMASNPIANYIRPDHSSFPYNFCANQPSLMFLAFTVNLSYSNVMSHEFRSTDRHQNFYARKIDFSTIIEEFSSPSTTAGVVCRCWSQYSLP